MLQCDKAPGAGAQGTRGEAFVAFQTFIRELKRRGIDVLKDSIPGDLIETGAKVVIHLGQQRAAVRLGFDWKLLDVGLRQTLEGIRYPNGAVRHPARFQHRAHENGGAATPDWSHLNHAGAMIASVRVANAIAGLDLEPKRD